jgi:hypothetical protein
LKSHRSRRAFEHSMRHNTRSRHIIGEKDVWNFDPKSPGTRDRETWPAGHAPTCLRVRVCVPIRRVRRQMLAHTS